MGLRPHARFELRDKCTLKLLIRFMEIEKQIAYNNNNLASFRKKWATFKQCPSENNLYS